LVLFSNVSFASSDVNIIDMSMTCEDEGSELTQANNCLKKALLCFKKTFSCCSRETGNCFKKFWRGLKWSVKPESLVCTVLYIIAFVYCFLLVMYLRKGRCDDESLSPIRSCISGCEISLKNLNVSGIDLSLKKIAETILPLCKAADYSSSCCPPGVRDVFPILKNISNNIICEEKPPSPLSCPSFCVVHHDHECCDRDFSNDCINNDMYCDGSLEINC